MNFNFLTHMRNAFLLGFAFASGAFWERWCSRLQWTAASIRRKASQVTNPSRLPGSRIILRRCEPRSPEFRIAPSSASALLIPSPDKLAGAHLLIAQAFLDDHGSNHMAVTIAPNGSNSNAIALTNMTTGAGSDHVVHVSAIRQFAAGEYIELMVFPNLSTNPLVDVCGPIDCTGSPLDRPATFFQAVRLCGS